MIFYHFYGRNACESMIVSTKWKAEVMMNITCNFEQT